MKVIRSSVKWQTPIMYDKARRDPKIHVRVFDMEMEGGTLFPVISSSQRDTVRVPNPLVL